MIDFDYFKRINDTLGHQAGDLVLKHMANLLQRNCRASDYLCRYGGEEMCVLLPNADEEVAAAWAERARRAIEAATLSIGDREVRATASFGVSASAATGDTAEQLIERADQSLIVAKKLGRNRVIRAGATTESSAVFEQVRQHGAVVQGYTAGQVMTTPVSALPAGVTVAEATDFLRQLRIELCAGGQRRRATDRHRFGKGLDLRAAAPELLVAAGGTDHAAHVCFIRGGRAAGCNLRFSRARVRTPSVRGTRRSAGGCGDAGQPAALV